MISNLLDPVITCAGIIASAIIATYEVKESRAQTIELRRPRFAVSLTTGYQANAKGKTVILYGNMPVDRAVKIASKKSGLLKINFENISDNSVYELYVAIYYHFQNDKNSDKKFISERFAHVGLLKGESIMLVPDFLNKGEANKVVCDKIIVRFLSSARELGFMVCGSGYKPNDIGPEKYYYVVRKNKKVTAAGIDGKDEMIKSDSERYNKLEREVLLTQHNYSWFTKK